MELKHNTFHGFILIGFLSANISIFLRLNWFSTFVFNPFFLITPGFLILSLLKVKQPRFEKSYYQ